MQNEEDIVQYPEYQGVTLKDIRSLQGRNMKPMTDKKKAELIYLLRECEEQENEDAI